MTIDSATKRFSMMNMGRPWLAVLPVPQGGFDHGGRFHLLSLYSAPIIFYWRGNVDTDWDNQVNWSLSLIGGANAGVPDANTICILGVSSAKACTLTANAFCYQLSLGATWSFNLNLSTFDMDVTADLDLLAGGILRGSGDLTIGGDFDQLGGVFSFNQTGSSPVMAVGGDFTVEAGSVWLITNLPGHTITVGGDLSIDTLTLTASAEWFLQVDGSAVVTSVNAAFSNATGFTQINAIDDSNTDSGNNLNWLFEQAIVIGTRVPIVGTRIDKPVTIGTRIDSPATIGTNNDALDVAGN
jgi:hypothetical protein